MKSGIFVLMATMVATNAYAVEHRAGKTLPAACNRLTGAAEDACLKQAGYTTETEAALKAQLDEQFKNAKKRLDKLEHREDEAAKAVKACGVGKTFAQRLKKCIDEMVDARSTKKEVLEATQAVDKLRDKVAEHDKVLVDHTQRIENVEAVVTEHGTALEDHEEKFEDHEVKFDAMAQKIDDLQETGPSVALLAGVAASRGGVPFNLGLGLGLPVAQGDARADTEVLVGLRPDNLALTVRERVRQAGDGLVLGGNVMFLAQGRSDLSAAREVLLGAGPSIGLSGERVSVTLDLAVGPDRVAKRGWVTGGSAGLTLAVKF